MRNERGVVLITSLMLMLLLLPLGLLFAQQAMIETQISTNYLSYTQALNAAESGVELALQFAKNDWFSPPGIWSFSGSLPNAGTYDVTVDNVTMPGESVVTSTGTYQNATQVVGATLREVPDLSMFSPEEIPLTPSNPETPCPAVPGPADWHCLPSIWQVTEWRPL